MSRNIFAALLIGIAAFAAGLASAWLVGQRIADRAMDDYVTNLTFEPEGRVRISIWTLKLLQAGDTAKAMGLIAVPLGRHSLFSHMQIASPRARRQWNRLAMDAEHVLTNLESAGKCGR